MTEESALQKLDSSRDALYINAVRERCTLIATYDAPAGLLQKDEQEVEIYAHRSDEKAYVIHEAGGLMEEEVLLIPSSRITWIEPLMDELGVEDDHATRNESPDEALSASSKVAGGLMRESIEQSGLKADVLETWSSE